MTPKIVQSSLALALSVVVLAGVPMDARAQVEPILPELSGPPRPQRQLPVSERLRLQDCRDSYAAGDYNAAQSACLELAEAGNVLAQRTLGMSYLAGPQTFNAERQAEKWIRKAAEAGDKDAEFTLGTMYLHGTGVTKVDKYAAEWIERAAAQRNLEAQDTIAYMYLVGQGVPKRADRAQEWYQRAAEAGYPRAQYNLGILYYKGTALPKDNAKALYWVRRAAANDYPDAKKFLADIDPRRER